MTRHDDHPIRNILNAIIWIVLTTALWSVVFWAIAGGCG